MQEGVGGGTGCGAGAVAGGLARKGFLGGETYAQMQNVYSQLVILVMWLQLRAVGRCSKWWGFFRCL
jgi:hypothetical protein